jgi:hypothetical protein
MDKYNDYLERIKGVRSGVDFDKLYIKITQRKRNAFLPAVASLAVAAVFVAVISFYFLRPVMVEDSILSYLTGEETVNGSQLIAYVFQ